MSIPGLLVLLVIGSIIVSLILNLGHFRDAIESFFKNLR